MQTNDDILSLLREKGAQAARQAQRAVILQPGAIGDCVLTLPLAQFMKESLGLGGVDILGHTEYTGILPGRTCIDSIRSIDSADLHRLFVEPNAFDLADRDPLINVFADYAWIVTFLGEPDSSFEQNLIFTANCSHSAEVITLSMKPPQEFARHLTEFYTEQFIAESGLSLSPPRVEPNNCLIQTSKADRDRGKELLAEIDIDSSNKVIIIQPGSGGLNKCWHLDNFLGVSKQISARGMDVVFLLGPAEVERFSKAKIKRISTAAKCVMDLSLTQVVAALTCADGFIGNDSGITHLAAGLGIKTLALFGPTNPTVYRPIGPAVSTFSVGKRAFAKKPSPRWQKKVLITLLGDIS